MTELDTSLLSYLADDASDFSTQVERFLETLRATERELAQASERRALPQLADAAHRILGQARMIGGGALASAASRLEGAARAGDSSTCREFLPRVTREIRAVTEALRHRPSAAQPA